MLEYKGNKCILCGYNKSKRALCFHHVDESQKLFTISSSHCHSWEKIKKELDKTVLLCSNCHMEVHEGLVNVLLGS
jgi:general stress protein 26